MIVRKGELPESWARAALGRSLGWSRQSCSPKMARITWAMITRGRIIKWRDPLTFLKGNAVRPGADGLCERIGRRITKSVTSTHGLRQSRGCSRWPRSRDAEYARRKARESSWAAPPFIMRPPPEVHQRKAIGISFAVKAASRSGRPGPFSQSSKLVSLPNSAFNAGRLALPASRPLSNRAARRPRN